MLIFLRLNLFIIDSALTTKMGFVCIVLIR